MGVKKIGEKAVFRTRRFTVFDAELEMNGKRVSKPYIKQNDCSEILAINGKGNVVLIRSYRPEIDCYVYELPAGTLKDGEDAKRGAIRELEEETGYSARKIEYLFGGYPLLGYSDCKLHFFLATGLKRKKQKLEDDESITVREFRPGEVLKMIRKGRIKDMCVLTAIQHYFYVLDQGRKSVMYADPD